MCHSDIPTFLLTIISAREVEVHHVKNLLKRNESIDFFLFDMK